MTTVGRWSPNKVRARVLDGTWVSPEELGGMVLLTPTSIAYTGTSASIGANGSVEFTACTALSLNGVFSADYDNYMVAIRAYTAVQADLYIRWRSSGTDNSTASSYVDQRLRALNATVDAAQTTASDKSRIQEYYSNLRWGQTLYCFGPYLAQPTVHRTVNHNNQSDASIREYVGTHNQSASYDGITLYTSTGTWEGLISVYGLVGA